MPKTAREPLKPSSIRFLNSEFRAISKAAAADGYAFGPWVREVALLAVAKGVRVKKTVEYKRSFRTRAA